MLFMIGITRAGREAQRAGSGPRAVVCPGLHYCMLTSFDLQKIPDCSLLSYLFPWFLGAYGENSTISALLPCKKSLTMIEFTSIE